MRLGEIKQVLDRATGDGHTLVIQHDPLFGDQAQRVNNYGNIATALEVLMEQEWSGMEVNNLGAFLADHPIVESTILNQSEFSQLNELVNTVNQKLPIFYSILEEIVEEQDERTINIKLPSGLDSLTKLSKFNKDMDVTLKLFSVDGQFEFKEFDKGTDWYVIIAVGVLTHRFFLAGLSTAQKYLEMRKAQFESKTAELEYRAALKADKAEPDEVKAFVDRKLDLVVEHEMKEAIANIGSGSFTPDELCPRLVTATKGLIKELDEGAEFHLSLNPPAYAEEHGGLLTIDYTKMRPLLAKQEVEEEKQLSAPAEPEESDKETD